MDSPKRLARLAGLLYLMLGVCSGVTILYIRPRVVVPGDAGATADNIASDAELFRLGFALDLIGITCFLLTAMALFKLLTHVNRTAAAAMVTFVAVAVAIQSLNMVNHLAALRVATGEPYAAQFGEQAADLLVVTFLDLHTVGFQVSQIFFGLWLLPLGYLAYRSGYFPKPLGVLLMIGSVSFLVDLPAQFLSHGLGPVLSMVVVAPATVAEPWLVGYLLLKGVRTPHRSQPLAGALRRAAGDRPAAESNG